MRASPPRHRASIVALAEENHVRIILNMVLNGFEKLNRLPMVRVPSPRRLWLTRPINRHILSMPFHESVPVLLIPSIVQRLHQPKVFLNCQNNTAPKLHTILTNLVLMREMVWHEPEVARRNHPESAPIHESKPSILVYRFSHVFQGELSIFEN